MKKQDQLNTGRQNGHCSVKLAQMRIKHRGRLLGREPKTKALKVEPDNKTAKE